MPASTRGPVAISASAPLFVAIVGGSGAGKSWLATKLHRALRPLSARLSLDDFYRDRSRLPPARRARLNFDHPRAIDWPRWEQALRVCAAGKIGRIPRYDFATHTRRVQEELFRPKPIVLVDGLWLLRRRSLRSLFAVRIYIDCPKKLRLRRRLGRDQQARRRTREAILRQFRQTVDPMHALYVAPQVGWATIRLQGKWGEKEVRQIAKEIREMRAAR